MPERPLRLCAYAWLALATFGTPAALSQPAPPSALPGVDTPGKLPAPPPSVRDLAYDSRLLSSAAAAESFQGPLDGGWVLSAEGGADLYAFRLVDRRDRLEGVWRDLRRPGDPAASGFLHEVRSTPAGLVLRFTPFPQAPAAVVLRRDLHGELDQGGTRAAVRLRREQDAPPQGELRRRR